MCRPPLGEWSATNRSPHEVSSSLIAAASASTTACRALDVSRSKDKVGTEPSGPWIITAAGRAGNALVMRGGLLRGRGYFPSRVANRMMGEPAIKGASAAQTWAWSGGVTDATEGSAGQLVPKKGCACMMEPISSNSGHDKSQVGEVAGNRESWRIEVFSYCANVRQGPLNAGLLPFKKLWG